MTPRAIVKLGTAALSDALGKRGGMCHSMQCRSGRAEMAGPAFPVRLHTADLLMVPEALAACPRGHVLVIDARGELNTAVWGELTTYAAERKGLAGVVIDGALRDLRKVAQSPLPVFARAVTPNAGGAEYLGEMDVAVSCGGQVVRPGDWVIGDDDGVVVIAAEKLEETVKLARRIVAVERQLEKAVKSGADLGSLLRIPAKVARKRSEVFLPQLGGE